MLLDTTRLTPLPKMLLDDGSLPGATPGAVALAQEAAGGAPPRQVDGLRVGRVERPAARHLALDLECGDGRPQRREGVGSGRDGRGARDVQQTQHVLAGAVAGHDLLLQPVQHALDHFGLKPVDELLVVVPQPERRGLGQMRDHASPVGVGRDRQHRRRFRPGVGDGGRQVGPDGLLVILKLLPSSGARLLNKSINLTGRAIGITSGSMNCGRSREPNTTTRFSSPPPMLRLIFSATCSAHWRPYAMASRPPFNESG